MPAEKFKEFLDLVETLIGPNGCPWDQQQTLKSLEGCLIEETHEVVEAIDTDDPEKIKEELGDLVCCSLFTAVVAQKEKNIPLSEMLQGMIDKLVRRHPHVFGDKTINTLEELAEQWEEIKSKEQAHVERKSEIDGIPPSLGALAKAQKVLKRLWHNKKISLPEESHTEEEIVDQLLGLLLQAEKKNISLETTLQKLINKLPERMVLQQEDN